MVFVLIISIMIMKCIRNELQQRILTLYFKNIKSPNISNYYLFMIIIIFIFGEHLYIVLKLLLLNIIPLIYPTKIKLYLMIHMHIGMEQLSSVRVCSRYII